MQFSVGGVLPRGSGKVENLDLSRVSDKIDTAPRCWISLQREKSETCICTRAAKIEGGGETPGGGSDVCV